MSARDNSGHRWSGWPGAYCFYCGSEDPREVCLGEGHDLDCKECVMPKCPVPDVIKDEADRKLNGPFNPPPIV